MPFAKQLPKGLSCYQPRSQIRLPLQIGRSAVAGRPSNSDRPLLTSLREETSQPAVVQAMPRLMVTAVARFVEHAGTAFPNLLVAIISWIVADFIDGCAAYAQAMYPLPPMTGEHVDPGVSVPTACPTPEILPPKRKPSLMLIAGNRSRSIGSKELCPSAGANRYSCRSAARSRKHCITNQGAGRWFVLASIDHHARDFIANETAPGASATSGHRRIARP